MAIEGITGAISNYQTAPQTVKITSTRPEPVAPTGYEGEGGSVSEISKDTRIVNNANGTTEENAQNDSERRQPSEETMKQALSDINKQLNNTECVFGIHEKTNRVTIRIVDKDTKEVIKELPPEKTLNMIAKVWELAGIMVDEKL